MDWLFEAWEDLLFWMPAILLALDILISAGTIAWVLMTKTDSASAVAWILFIIFLPFVGFIAFFLFGYQHINRPLKRKRRHKLRYQPPPQPAGYTESSANLSPGEPLPDPIPKDSLNGQLARLAHKFGAYSVTMGNQVDFFADGCPAIEAMLEAMRQAKHHIHVQVYIFQPDELGRQVLELLTAKAKSGVEVRLLYDAMGSYRLGRRRLWPLREAGGKTSTFLPINPFRRRLQINMRNHRKILVVDGSVGFLGGLNIGDEYLGKVARYGFWRDTHLRLEGPAVYDLQRVFCEDWDFAAGENLSGQTGTGGGSPYFQALPGRGPFAVQIIDSGPDRDPKGIRELIFAAIAKASKRVWIASPYFIPDRGLLDALRMAAYSGLDVRLLGQLRPDRWIPHFAAHYYWGQVLPAGVKVYKYRKGMMHAKVFLIDDAWATVGTANLDNRSMYLNFEVNCLLYSAQAVRVLEEQFERDFADADRLDRHQFVNRSFLRRLTENACRLLSPIL